MTGDGKELIPDGQAKEAPKISDLYGWQRGSVIIPPGFDLTKPVLDESFLAEDREFYSRN